MWLRPTCARSVQTLLLARSLQFPQRNRSFNFCLTTDNKSRAIGITTPYQERDSLTYCCTTAPSKPSASELDIVANKSTRYCRNPGTVSREYHTCSARCQKLKGDSDSGKRAMVETREKESAQLTLGAKVQQAGKDVTYTAIIIAGVAITGLMFYAIGRELFSGQSPSGIYDRAFKLCEKHQRLSDEVGHPMKAYGEMTSRGRRRFVRHQEYEMNGVKYMRLNFYVEGPLNKATVHVEAMQDERGKYQFRYIFAELEHHPRKTIIIEDNR